MKISADGTIETTQEDYNAIFSAAFNTFNYFKESFLVPKNRKQKIGVIVALRTEKNKEKIILENDVIHELNNYLINSCEGNKFSVLRYPEKIINKIHDRYSATKYLNLSKAHFIIYGSISERKINGKESYIFKLNGVVRHAEIPILISQSFGKEFRDVLPGKISFAENDEALGFEVTERYIQYVVKYVVAIAAFVSGDLELSKSLLLELKNELSLLNQTDSIQYLFQLKRRLPIRISEVMVAYLNCFYGFYVESRDKKYITAEKFYLDTLKEVDPNNYSGHLHRAIYLFFDEDIAGAINELRNINNSDVTWRFSLAFLLAYTEDVDGALENFKKIFHRPLFTNVIDVEIFISEVLCAHPEKVQLIFFRALINFKIKKDFILARSDFELFINSEKSHLFLRLRDLAEKYLSEIEVFERRKILSSR